MSEIYLGLMSGTSLDAMDVVAANCSESAIKLIASHTKTIPSQLKEDLQTLCQPGSNEIARMASADPAVARLSAEAVNELMVKAGLQRRQITAIGSHGQTVRHLPEQGYTLQLGDPSLLAELTGMPVVADFRRRDMAAGGQGAPLVPAFHQALFSSHERSRVIVNIGGISNISILPSGHDSGVVTGFDTGPGNLMMDAWCQQHRKQPFDKDGLWAASEPHDEILLETLLSDPYFRQLPPKSTGRERFSPTWLDFMLKGFSGLSPACVQATLCRLTARCIAIGISQHAPDTEEVFVCGGGASNKTLMSILSEILPDAKVTTTQELGIAPQWVEATAFAWLAKQHIQQLSGNLPDVTGAGGLRILGGLYPA